MGVRLDIARALCRESPLSRGRGIGDDAVGVLSDTKASSEKSTSLTRHLSITTMALSPFSSSARFPFPFPFLRVCFGS